MYRRGQKKEKEAEIGIGMEKERGWRTKVMWKEEEKIGSRKEGGGKKGEGGEYRKMEGKKLEKQREGMED